MATGNQGSFFIQNDTEHLLFTQIYNCPIKMALKSEIWSKAEALPFFTFLTISHLSVAS